MTYGRQSDKRNAQPRTYLKLHLLSHKFIHPLSWHLLTLFCQVLQRRGLLGKHLLKPLRTEFGPWNHSGVLKLLDLTKLNKDRIQHVEKKHWSLSYHWSIFYSKPSLSKCKVPARLCEDLRFGAMAEFGEASVTRTSTVMRGEEREGLKQQSFLSRPCWAWKAS